MIYLDHHAATPLSTAVQRAMAAAHAQAWANPESVHQAGRAARALREGVRARLAAVIKAKPADLVLAGTGTEALHLGLLGLARARRAAGHDKLVLGALEHPAVRGAAQLLQAEGFRVHTLALSEARPPAPELLAAALGDDSACVAIQWVNHETGTVFPSPSTPPCAAPAACRCWSTRARHWASCRWTWAQLNVSALVVAAAKIGGPAGVSALWHERCVELAPLLSGGAQERGLRPGTPDVAALAGFGRRAGGTARAPRRAARIAALRDRFERAAVALGAELNGAEAERVATVTNVGFPGWRADILVAALDLEGLCVSAGAACSSGCRPLRR
jgi:cysteine desulfurase